ncbi:MAG: nucleoside recognition domain-containing protein, partial [Thiomicrorhabdus sp.]|nr:nucleoside recognition domain-containing protein [Thiomicrorhabdus sp.]
FTLSTLDKMVKYFDGEIGAYAYLLLILLYFPCVATFGAIKQELGWRWAMYSASWSMFLGYSVSVGFYQIASYSQHPLKSLIWVSIILLAFSLLYAFLWKTGQPYRKKQQKTGLKSI